MLHPEKEVQQVRVVGWVAPGRVWAMISRSLALKGSRRSVAQKVHRAAAAVGCLEGILAVGRAWVVVLEGVVVPAVRVASAVVGVVDLGERRVSDPGVAHSEQKDLFDSMICWHHFVAAVVVGCLGEKWVYGPGPDLRQIVGHREGRLVAGPVLDLPEVVGHREGRWVSGLGVVHSEKKDLVGSTTCWRRFVAAVVVGHREGRLVAGPGSELPQAVGHCEGKRPCRRGHWAAVGQEES